MGTEKKVGEQKELQVDAAMPERKAGQAAIAAMAIPSNVPKTAVCRPT